MTCWRRLRDWHQAGVWQRLHEVLLAGLNAAGMLDWSGAVIDSSHVRALKGGPNRAEPGRSCPARLASRSGKGHPPGDRPARHGTWLWPGRAPLGGGAVDRAAALVGVPLTNVSPAPNEASSPGRASEQRLAIGRRNARASARRPGGRTGLKRRLDGGGGELRGLRVDDDVPAEQHAADNLPGVPERVLRVGGHVSPPF